MQAGGLTPPPPLSTGSPTTPTGSVPPGQFGAPASAPPATGVPTSAPVGQQGYPPTGIAFQSPSAMGDDSRRGIEFVFAGLQGGATYASLEALHSSAPLALPSVSRSGFGVTGGARAGLRLLYLTAGPSFRITNFTDYMLWTLNLDFEWRIPLGLLEPYVGFGGGYARVASLDDPTPGAANTTVHGFDLRLAGGVDYYLASFFSLGASWTLEMLRVSRGASPAARSQVVDPIWQVGASALGLATTLGLHTDFHF